MSIKLLFADDSVTMQKVIQLTLENEKVDLLFASDGNKAFALAREERPDVVIADVYMPGLDGFQLCEKLKKTTETAAIPVILISGELENYDPAQGAAAGAVGHITKPFKSGEFIELIKQYSGSAAGEAPKKAGRGKVKTVPAPVMDTEAEDEDEAFEPAVIELIDRAAGEPADTLDAGEELEVVDEDIDDLAEDLDELDEEIEGEILEEDEAADEEEEPAAAAAPSSRKGRVSLDDVLPSAGEVDAAIALEAVRETTASPAEDLRIYDDGAGDLVAEAHGADLPSVHMEEGDDAARILADVLNVAEAPPAERKEEVQRGDEALEDALDSLDRAATAPTPEKPAPAKPVAGRAAAHAPEDDLWDKSLDEVDQALAVTEAEREPVKEEGNDGIWNAPKRELEEAVRRAVETSAPAIIAAETGGLPPERLEELFRETVGRAVDEFIAARAEEVFRGEMRRAIETRFKESLDTQMEKVFREEIGRVMAAGFQKAMPRMLAIIDKITVQITPRIAQHMIKIAIERIKKGEIN
ncbi:MAG: response regulator [Nitrospinae bacterium]|nr:response regulator [Nitrospinota bacterium]